MTQDGAKREITTDAGYGPPIQRSRLERLQIRSRNMYKRNKALLVKPAFWRVLPALVRNRFGASSHREDAPIMFVATHHKSMTTYFTAVLQLLGFGLRLPYESLNLQQPQRKTRLFLSAHGKIDLDRLGPYRGVHVMRDPRDMIVSGYHYHKWTSEDWVHRPDEQGRSYQQKLLAAEQDEGLFMEINHFIFFYRELLENWDMDDPDMLEVRYTDLMGADRESIYNRIFAHLGLEGADHDLAVKLMRLFEASSRTGKKKTAIAQKSHVRSGKSGQWHQVLTPAHLDYIEAELGPVLRKFGYGCP